MSAREGEGVKQKQTPADMGGGTREGQAKVDVHFWLKFDKYLISNLELMKIKTMLLKASDKSILVFYKVSHFIIFQI